MLTHLKLERETLLEHGEIILALDELVGLSTMRVAVHDKFIASLHENWRLAGDEFTAYYFVAACFIAQRACHTAQAIALLLRHGFAVQAFELWRTLFNLDLTLAQLSSDDDDDNDDNKDPAERYLSAALKKEDAAERYFSAALAEVHELDREAAELGYDDAKLVDEPYSQRLSELFDQLLQRLGNKFRKRDGWQDPKARDNTKKQARQAGILDLYVFYQRASKSQHGAPASMFVRAASDPEFRPDPLEHSVDGVPFQCFLTALLLDKIVSKFCGATNEVPIHEEPQWSRQSGQLVFEIHHLCGDDSA